MKKYTSRIVAIVFAMVMAFSLSGCVIAEGTPFSIDTDAMLDFIINGWDGIYEEKERAEYVAPDPTVRTHEIRENYKKTTVNNTVTDKHRVTTVNNVVDSKSAGTDTIAASTDY